MEKDTVSGENDRGAAGHNKGRVKKGTQGFRALVESYD
jgi:hypothetical protein